MYPRLVSVWCPLWLAPPHPGKWILFKDINISVAHIPNTSEMVSTGGRSRGSLRPEWKKPRHKRTKKPSLD
jgi:hypothetical protein